MHWQMLQIKNFTALQKMSHFQDLQTVHGGTKYSVPPRATRNIIVSQRKPILVIVSIKPFTCQCFGQNYFSREIEWAVLLRHPLKLYYNLCDNVPEYTLNPLEPRNLLKILMILNMVIAIN